MVATKSKFTDDNLLRSQLIMQKLKMTSPSVIENKPIDTNKDLILLIEDIVEKTVDEVIIKRLNQIMLAKTQSQTNEALYPSKKSFYIEGEEIL